MTADIPNVFVQTDIDASHHESHRKTSRHALRGRDVLKIVSFLVILPQTEDLHSLDFLRESYCSI